MIEDEIEFEGQESIETEFLIDHVDETRKSIIYGLYSQLNPFANFFGRIQYHFKKVAFTWLFSSFVAIEYLFSSEAKNLPINPILGLIFISLLAIFGIFLIWFLDVPVYQTYFYGVITEESKLEHNHKWLPKVNLHFGAAQYKEKKYSVGSFFYIGCNLILLLIICSSMLKLININMLNLFLVVLSFIILGWLLSYVMLRVEFPKRKVPIREFFKKKYKKSNH